MAAASASPMSHALGTTPQLTHAHHGLLLRHGRRHRLAHALGAARRSRPPWTAKLRHGAATASLNHVFGAALELAHVRRRRLLQYDRRLSASLVRSALTVNSLSLAVDFYCGIAAASASP